MISGDFWSNKYLKQDIWVELVKAISRHHMCGCCHYGENVLEFNFGNEQYWL